MFSSLKLVPRQKELGDKVKRKIRKVKKVKLAKQASDEDTEIEEVNYTPLNWNLVS